MPALFQIQQLNWHKRRAATKQPEPVAVEIPDFQKTVNHMCQVQVQFDDGTTAILTGRIGQNPISGTWTVSAINGQGQSVAARYLGEE